LYPAGRQTGRARTPRAGRRREEERETAAEEGARLGEGDDAARRTAARGGARVGGRGGGPIWEAKGDASAGLAASIWEAKGDGEEDGGARRSARRGTADAVRPF